MSDTDEGIAAHNASNAMAEASMYQKPDMADVVSPLLHTDSYRHSAHHTWAKSVVATLSSTLPAHRPHRQYHLRHTAVPQISVSSVSTGSGQCAQIDFNSVPARDRMPL